MHSTAVALMLGVIGVANAGCSLIYTRGPQPEVQPPPPCTTSVAAPVVDSVLAAASLGLLALGVVELSKPPSEDFLHLQTTTGTVAVVTGIVTSIVFIGSAGVGYNRTAACRASLEAKPQQPASLGSPPSSLLRVPPQGCQTGGDAPRICSSAASWEPSAVVVGEALH